MAMSPQKAAPSLTIGLQSLRVGREDEGIEFDTLHLLVRASCADIVGQVLDVDATRDLGNAEAAGGLVEGSAEVGDVIPVRQVAGVEIGLGNEKVTVGRARGQQLLGLRDGLGARLQLRVGAVCGGEPRVEAGSVIAFDRKHRQSRLMVLQERQRRCRAFEFGAVGPRHRGRLRSNVRGRGREKHQGRRVGEGMGRSKTAGQSRCGRGETHGVDGSCVLVGRGWRDDGERDGPGDGDGVDRGVTADEMASLMRSPGAKSRAHDQGVLTSSEYRHSIKPGVFKGANGRPATGLSRSIEVPRTLHV